MNRDDEKGTHVKPCTAFPSASPASEISSVQRPTWFRYKRKSYEVVDVQNDQFMEEAIMKVYLEHRDSLDKQRTIGFTSSRQRLDTPQSTQTECSLLSSNTIARLAHIIAVHEVLGR